jgi:chemosensory pili system protein ChpA (sensor histidine kinase/response regulator)
VGLDSVKAAVEALRGAVQVESSPGAGTTFRIRLPLTLAAARVTMIRVGAEQYALPVAGIVRTSLVPVDKLRRTEASERLLVDGADHQVIRLAEVLGLSGTAPQGDASRTNLTVLQVTLGSENYALVVDEVLEARQIVVKALSPWLKKAPCMTGATVLGDGRVVLILNPTELFQPRGLLQLKRGRRVETSTGQRPLDILIVDDSISVRRVVANVIMSAGWNPIQAKDGVEALELLHDAPRNPDAILMDIEMPRMDGFELTARLRSQERYKSVPILMLTSRAGEKHRTKAMSAGVTDYLIKPFHDKALLAAVRRHVADARSRPKSVA